jgi:ATP-dependent DNA helicase UvrD/PcrA
MSFIADLHIHSYLSRATSKQMNLENIYKWAQLKGVTVVGTGDFTHPKWFAEMQEKLEPAEPGLFKLKDKYCTDIDKEIPGSCRAAVRFVLSVEISTIYKKGDKTRRVHSLILSPDFQAAGRLNAALQEIGNIKSDGRPIIGMDCKRLLQFALDSSAENFFIPAHIWTPHFAVLGSKSGFDSIEECFEDLTPHIFALETGLSSDPSMNWTLSNLDNFVLVSNSDAHSPSKLAREANIFTCGLSYFDMIKALKEKDKNGFKGTIEFHPEEGKYHYDGHRRCKVRMGPEETIANDGNCPECGKKVTVGVMHRVKLLSDRKNGFKPDKAFNFESIVPLVEILSEINGVGVNSKKVSRAYFDLLERFGNELNILRNFPLTELKQAGDHILAHAIDNMRKGKVSINPGYDGEYGTVKVLEPGKKQQNQLSLF